MTRPELPPGVTLRPITGADEPFLARLFATTREAELAPVPWTDEQKAAFVAQQFAAQSAAYGAYEVRDFQVIEQDGEPIGRLYLTEMHGGLHVTDLALLPEQCGQGIGSAVLAQVIADGDASGRPVSLYVERWNPAQRLYARLGFVPIGSDDVYLLLQRPVGG